MTHKHIGGPGGLGKSLGKWVTCPTTPDKCRLKNTLHVEVETLKEVRTWTGKRSFNEVTVEDYQDYLKSYLAGTLGETRKPQKREREDTEITTVDDVLKKVFKREKARRGIISIPALPTKQVADYVPLNLPTPEAQAALEELEAYEAKGTGAFGRKTALDKTQELLVRNQYVLTINAGAPIIKKTTALNYKDRAVVFNLSNRDYLHRIGRRQGSSAILKQIKEVIDADREADVKKKHAHDHFLAISKPSLTQEVETKNPADKELLLEAIRMANKPSDIYKIKQIVSLF